MCDEDNLPIQFERMVFVDADDGEYVWENHVYGRLPLKEPDDIEIIFYDDQLWQNEDNWSLIVFISDDDDDSDIELEKNKWTIYERELVS